jgi:hypothetical protein
MNYLHILQANGYYEEPVPFNESGISFINDEGKRVKPPEKFRCEHPKHVFLRKDRKFKYNINEMYVLRWKISIENIENAPISSFIPVPPMIICKYCYEYEMKENHE